MTDERYKALMEQVGMPNSRSLLGALQQVANEVEQEVRAALAQHPASNPWREVIDAALIASGLDCLGPQDQPTEAVQRLIEWEHKLALDPTISAEAAALLNQQPPAPTAQPATEDDLRVYDAIAAGYAQPVQQPGADTAKKLVNEFGRACAFGNDETRVRAGDALLAALLAAPAQRQPLTAEAVFASKDFMSMNGLYWGLGIETLMQIVRVTERECAAAWGVTLAQKGEKL